jgi:hypothetical protein
MGGFKVNNDAKALPPAELGDLVVHKKHPPETRRM